MDKLITLLQGLFSLNKVASVTLPGLLTAAGLSIILWPPPPTDEVPIVENLARGTFLESTETYPTNMVIPAERACTVKFRPLDKYQSLETIWGTQIQNQSLLDEQKNQIAECIEIETNRMGLEKTQNDNLALDIADLQKLLAAALETYGNYEKNDNPLAGRFRSKSTELQDQIQTKRDRILLNEQRIRDRNQHLAELNRYDKIISERLADPGRLRPRKTFDDVLAALINHIVAFILLALTLGAIVTPVTQAGSAGFFDWLFPGGY